MSTQSPWRCLPPNHDQLLQHLSLSSSTNLPFELRRDEQKGWGVYALQDFERGDSIFTEQPIFVLPHDWDPADALDVVDGLEGLSKDLFQHLHPKEMDQDDAQHGRAYVQRSQFRIFLPHAIDPNVCKKEISQGTLMNGMIHNANEAAYAYCILQNNAFGVTVTNGDWEEQDSILPLASRLNHSCRPNASTCGAIWRTEGKVEVFAIKPIKAGEEICVSYLSDDQKKCDVHTRGFLLEAWGFRCACPECIKDRRK